MLNLTFKEFLAVALAKGHEGIEASAHPDSNTGANMTETNIEVSNGWLQFKIDTCFLQSVRTDLERYLGLKFAADYGSRWYDKAVKDASGASIYFEHRGTGEDHVLVVIPATVLEGIPVEARPRFIWFINSMSPQFTRFDANIDLLYNGAITPLEILNKLDSEESRLKGFHKDNYAYHKNKLGKTLNCGTRGSNGNGYYIRIYDAHGHTRIEAEITGKRAQEAWELYSYSTELESGGMASCLASLVLGSVDFVEPKSERMDRNERSDWWYEVHMVVAEEPIRIKTQPRVCNKSLTARVIWLKKTVARSLAVCDMAFKSSRSFVYDLLTEGYDNLRESDYSIANVSLSPYVVGATPQHPLLTPYEPIDLYN